jgi:hypothetical protein
MVSCYGKMSEGEEETISFLESLGCSDVEKVLLLLE